MEQVDPVALIRDYAARGLSKRETMQTLGWGEVKLNHMLDLLGNVEWAPRSKTVNRRLYNESMKGCRSPSQLANAAKARAALREKSAKTVRGFTGSVQEVIDKFSIPTSVSCVRRRLAQGMSLDDAFFTPNKAQVCGKATNNGWR